MEDDVANMKLDHIEPYRGDQKFQSSPSRLAGRYQLYLDKDDDSLMMFQSSPSRLAGRYK